MNTTSTTEINPRNIGLWNWIPHPIWYPALLMSISPKASIIKLDKIPNAVARKCARTWYNDVRSTPRKDPTLSDKIGKTHVNSEEETSRRRRWGSRHAWKPLRTWLKTQIRRRTSKTRTMACWHHRRRSRHISKILPTMTNWTSLRALWILQTKLKKGFWLTASSCHYTFSRANKVKSR